jgi:hypothetical protein
MNSVLAVFYNKDQPGGVQHVYVSTSFDMHIEPLHSTQTSTNVVIIWYTLKDTMRFGTTFAQHRNWIRCKPLFATRIDQEMYCSSTAPLILTCIFCHPTAPTIQQILGLVGIFYIVVHATAVRHNLC